MGYAFFEVKMKFELYEMLIELPFLRKGQRFWCDEQTGIIYGDEDGNPMTIPLREGLRGYIWLLMTRDCRFIKWVDTDDV